MSKCWNWGVGRKNWPWLGYGEVMRYQRRSAGIVGAWLKAADFDRAVNSKALLSLFTVICLTVLSLQAWGPQPQRQVVVTEQESLVTRDNCRVICEVPLLSLIPFPSVATARRLPSIPTPSVLPSEKGRLNQEKIKHVVAAEIRSRRQGSTQAPRGAQCSVVSSMVSRSQDPTW